MFYLWIFFNREETFFDCLFCAYTKDEIVSLCYCSLLVSLSWGYPVLERSFDSRGFFSTIFPCVKRGLGWLDMASGKLLMEDSETIVVASGTGL